MIDLMAAIKSRWNAASLNSSIATLYPAGDGNKTRSNRTGSPAGSALPRAEYQVITPAPSTKTRGSRIFNSIAQIRVWTNSPLASGTHVKSIRAAFVGQESLMTMTDGTILECDDGGMLDYKEDDDVFMGQLTLIFRVRIAE